MSKGNEIVRVRYVVRTNRVGSECEDVVEFDRDEWESMSEKDREEAMQEAAFDEVDWSWELES